MSVSSFPSPDCTQAPWADSREVLQDDAGGSERHLHALALGLLPVQDALHVRRLHQELVTVPDGRLQQHADGERETL